MDTDKKLIFSGLGLIFAFLVMGFMPVISSQGVSCGSIFHASDDAFTADLTTSMSGFGAMNARSSCEDKRGTLKLMTVPFIVVGGLLAAAGMVVGPGMLTRLGAPELH